MTRLSSSGQIDSVKEQMMAVYRNETPDKVPVSIYTRYIRRGAFEREVRNLGLGIIDYAPPVSMLAPAWHLLPGFLSEVRGAEFRVRYRWTDGRRVERREFETPVGTVFQDTELDPAGAGSEHIRSHYVTSRDDYRVIEYLFRNTRFEPNEDLITRRMKDLGADGVVLGRVDRSPYQKLLLEIVGPEQFLVDLAVDPEPVEQVLHSAQERLNEAMELIVDSAAEIIWLPENVTVDMTPPPAFEIYHLDYYRRWADICADRNKPLAVHIDGRLRPLSDLLKKAGIPIIESVSAPSIGGDLELGDAQRLFPDAVILPNVPSNWAVLDSQAISNNLSAMAEGAVPGRPWMLQFSEDLPEDELGRVMGVVVQHEALR